MSKNSMNFNVNFNSQFDSSQILKGLEEIRKKMGALSANEQIFKGVDKEFLKLKSLLTTLDTQSKNVGNPAGLNLYQRTLEKVRESANKISQEMSSIAKNETKAFQFKDVAEAQKKIQQLNAQIEKANKDLSATSTSTQNQLKGMGITADDKTLSTYVQQLSQGKSLVSVITQELIRQTAEVNKIRQKYEELNKESRNVKISADDQIASKGSYKTKTQAEAATTQTIKTAISTNFANGVKDAAVVLANIQSLLDAQGIKLNENSKVWDNIKNTYTQLVAKQQTLNAQFEPMKSSMTQLANTTSNIVNRGLNDAVPGFQNLQNKLVQNTNEVNNLNGKLQATNDEMNNLNSQGALDTVGKDTEKATIKTEALINAQQSSINAQRDMNSQQQILNQAFDRIGMAVKNVLSLGNAWRQVNRYIRQTFQDVQRLDQAFASIAMVTNYQMSDLWGMYDQYSEIANRLGQTTEGAIKSSALFIQQGLEMSEALSLAEDTLKMATLAGEDYTTATTQMTAAIRGFHMEMDESSRVTDVYSELAANAAASVQGIAYAMSKTASIANNAGMAFETTAAFITNMIETTQEAPENIGTAMKTIIARFTELKTNVDDSGEDLGSMDFNKVDKALKSVGVQLKDTTGSFRNLDEVFLELSSKWDSLTRNQQRYIATIAAGSRQQSRFIAMMEDYDRTLELVETAQNSAGRSDEQFAKYADTIVYKLNQVKNSWEELRVSFLNAEDYGKGLDFVNKFLSEIKDIDPKALVVDLGFISIIGTKIVTGIINSLKTNTPKIQSAFDDMTRRLNVATAISNTSTKYIEKVYEKAIPKLQAELSRVHLTIPTENITQDFTKLVFKANELAGAQERIYYNANKELGVSKQQLITYYEHVIAKEKELATAGQTANKEEQIANSLKTQFGLTQEQALEYYKICSQLDEYKVKLEQVKGSLRQQKLTDEEINRVINNRIQMLGEETNRRRQNIQQAQNTLVNEVTTSVANGVSNGLAMGIMTGLSTGDWDAAWKTGLTTLGFSLVPLLTKGLTSLLTKIMAAMTGPIAIGIGAAAAAIALGIWLATKDSIENQIKELEKTQKKLQEEQTKLQEAYSEKRNERSEYESEIKDLKELSKLQEDYDKQVYHTQEEKEEFQNKLQEYVEDYGSVLKNENGIYEVQNKLLEEKVELLKEQLRLAAQEELKAKSDLINNEEAQKQIAQTTKALSIDQKLRDSAGKIQNNFIYGKYNDESGYKFNDSGVKKYTEELFAELEKLDKENEGKIFKFLGITNEDIKDIEKNYEKLSKAISQIMNENIGSVIVDFNLNEPQDKRIQALKAELSFEDIDTRYIDYYIQENEEAIKTAGNLVEQSKKIKDSVKDYAAGIEYLNKVSIDNPTLGQIKDILTNLDNTNLSPENKEFVQDYYSNIIDEFEEQLADASELNFDESAFDNLTESELKAFSKNLDDALNSEKVKKEFQKKISELNLSPKEIGFNWQEISIENYQSKMEQFIAISDRTEKEAKEIFQKLIRDFSLIDYIDITVVDEEEFQKQLEEQVKAFESTLSDEMPTLKVPVELDKIDTSELEKYIKYLNDNSENLSNYLSNGVFDLQKFIDFYNSNVNEKLQSITSMPALIAQSFAMGNAEIIKAYEETTGKELKSASELFDYYENLQDRERELQSQEKDFYETYKDIFANVYSDYQQTRDNAQQAIANRYLNDVKQLENALKKAKENYEKYQDVLDKEKALENARKDLVEKREDAQKKIDDQIKKNLENEEKAIKDIKEALKDVEEQQKTILEKEEAIVDKTKEWEESVHGTTNYLYKEDPLKNYTDKIEQLSKAAEKAKDALENPVPAQNIQELIDNYGKAIHEEMVYQKALNQRNEDRKNQILNYLQGYGSQYFDFSDGFLQANDASIRSMDANDQIKDQIHEYVDSYNKLQQEIIDGEDKYTDLLNEIKDKRKDALDDLVKLQEDTAKILEESYKQEIDDVKDKYDAIKDADNDYLAALEDAINKQKELRDKENKYNDLATKEKKLSLLSRDTSGTQQKEILKLEEEIQKDRQSMLDDSINDIINTLKEIYEEQQKEREEEIQFQEQLLDDMNFMKEAAALLQTFNGQEDYLAWLMQNDPEYLNGTDLQQEQYLLDHENDFNAYDAYNGFTNAQNKFNDYLNTTQEEVDKAISSLSDDLANYLEISHQNVLDKVQEEQTSTHEAMEQAYVDLDEAKEKLSELDQKVIESYENYDEVIQEGEDALNEAYENQKKVIEDTEENLIKAQNAYNDALLNVYGTCEKTIDEITTDAEVALAEYHSIQMSYADDMEKVKTSMIEAMRDVATAAMDEEWVRTIDQVQSNSVGTDWKIAADEFNARMWEAYGQNRGAELESRLNNKLNELNSESDELFTINDNIIHHPDYNLDSTYPSKDFDDNLKKIEEKEKEKKNIEQKLAKIKENPTYQRYYTENKTGGIVDYTGFAWVDGTPTKPEAFLSAEDTARIGAAAQLLSNLPFLNPSSITDNSYSSNIGDTTIEVHINIENVSSEMDIDEMVNRVRDDIVEMSNQIGNPILLNK